MGQIVILGTANAVADEAHENTHLAIRQGERTVLVDCVGSPVVRLRQAGIPFESLTDLIVTHFHPDHVSGVPLLLMDLWLMGRQAPLQVHGLGYTLQRLEQMMDLYRWKGWPGFFPVSFNPVAEMEMANVIEGPDLRIFASPVKHLLPTIGLRVEFRQEGKTAAYSCDSEPCEPVVELARGVDVLIHESAGASVGHSSAGQAGEVARRAGAARLLLIHYPTEAQGMAPEELLEQARATYEGPVELARDFMKVDF